MQISPFQRLLVLAAKIRRFARQCRLSFRMWREGASSEQSKVGCGVNQDAGRNDSERDDEHDTTNESASARDVRTDHVPVLQGTLDEYCHHCASVTDARRSGTVEKDGQKLVIFYWTCFKRSTATGAWKYRWPILTR